MQAELLVDTGYDMDINISAYKADQLGLPKSRKPVKVEMGQAASGEVRRRGVVKAAVLMEDDGPGVLEDDLCIAYLEVWSDEPDLPGPHTTGTESSGSDSSQVASHPDCAGMADAAGSGILVIKLSPVKGGKDSRVLKIFGRPWHAAVRSGHQQRAPQAVCEEEELPALAVISTKSALACTSH